MGIQALPQTTVRTLGASQVLNDPAAVIKELVDNALDARATSIAIEISNNTLDSIQVRDNGHGIPPEDRHLVARPHCTSKIGSEDDLRDIGGSSLGFRGEALASVAEMSGSLTISTRIEGEQVATALKISQSGEVADRERASLPVGTTIKVIDFLKSHPVRKQVMLKGTEKTLKKVKETLQSYAFARPHVRYSLRVLKAKNDKGNWMYAPKPGGNAEDAAFKIVGAACASQCTWSVIEDHGFTLQSFVPKSDADVSKIGNIGSFLSVDSRPVSTSRGTPKQIVKTFRETLKRAGARFAGVKDPFIYLAIVCPPASYDANVEPAKDDVLFETPDEILGLARRVFDAVYPAEEVVPRAEEIVETRQTQPQQAQQLREEDDFTTSLETTFLADSNSKSATHPVSGFLSGFHGETGGYESQITLDRGSPVTDSLLKRRTFRTNMYGCDEEDLDLLDERPPTGRTEEDFEELRAARKDINVSNPWVLAKLNTSLRRPAILQGREDNANTESSSIIEPSTHDRPQVNLGAETLPTPRPSSPSLQPTDFHPSDHVPDIRIARDGRVIGPQSLPPPQTFVRSTSPFIEHADRGSPQEQSSEAPAYNYTLFSQAMEPPMGTPLHAIPDTGTKSRRSPRKQLHQAQINTPFVSPVKDQPPREKVWFDHLDLTRHQSGKKRQHQMRGNTGLVAQGELGDLFDHPRPLTPPRRNRDMRDFVSTVDPTANDRAASLIESGHYLQRDLAGTGEGSARRPGDQGDENAVPASGLVGSRGFIRASGLAAADTQLDPSKHAAPRPAKRRKTSDSRVLRELSGNATTLGEHGDQDSGEPPGGRTASRRRRTTDGSKVPRTKSSRLPLERTPAGQGVHGIVLKLSTSIHELAGSAGKIDEGLSLLNWNEPSLDAYDTFAITPDPRKIQEMAGKLQELLINRVSDGEMVQDLGRLVRNAFAAHEERVVEWETV
ncbi:hypothetical protein LTR37_004597 [Vermiconidia calcicola]|uniref:Uncharacterized protein n=1 Tax=Vermiconidia calcicola TaxID=1690605 RepID=A0ACC3NLN8_9PEZI|nr:hypothetical protein LTR37_004597 [Vermiconidia calcicola]